MGRWPVRVRVVWEVAGVELVDAVATRWTDTAVHCRWSDPRAPTEGVWFPVRDVEER